MPSYSVQEPRRFSMTSSQDTIPSPPTPSTPQHLHYYDDRGSFLLHPANKQLANSAAIAEGPQNYSVGQASFGECSIMDSHGVVGEDRWTNLAENDTALARLNDNLPMLCKLAVNNFDGLSSDFNGLPTLPNPSQASFVTHDQRLECEDAAILQDSYHPFHKFMSSENVGAIAPTVEDTHYDRASYETSAILRSQNDAQSSMGLSGQSSEYESAFNDDQVPHSSSQFTHLLKVREVDSEENDFKNELDAVKTEFPPMSDVKQKLEDCLAGQIHAKDKLGSGSFENIAGKAPAYTDYFNSYSPTSMPSPSWTSPFSSQPRTPPLTSSSHPSLGTAFLSPEPIRTSVLKQRRKRKAAASTNIRLASEIDFRVQIKGKQKRHWCSCCGKAYSRSEHRTRHENPNPANCYVPGCTKVLNRADNLVSHLVTHVSENTRQPEKRISMREMKALIRMEEMRALDKKEKPKNAKSMIVRIEAGRRKMKVKEYKQICIGDGDDGDDGLALGDIDTECEGEGGSGRRRSKM